MNQCENCPLVDPILDLIKVIGKLCEEIELFVKVSQVGANGGES